MKTRRTVPIVVLALIILLGALTPADSAAGQKSLVGSWIVDVMPDQPGPPPLRNLVTNTSDGTTVNTDPEFGTGHGIWKKTGPREFAAKFLTLIPSGHPFGEGTITVTATLTIDKDGDTATGPFTTVFDATTSRRLLPAPWSRPGSGSTHSGRARRAGRPPTP